MIGVNIFIGVLMFMTTCANALTVNEDTLFTEDNPDFDSVSTITAGINYMAMSFYDGQANGGDGGYYIRIYSVNHDTGAMTLDGSIDAPGPYGVLNNSPSVTMNNVFYGSFGQKIMFWGREDYEILAVFFSDNAASSNPSLGKVQSVVHITKESGTWKAMKRLNCHSSGTFFLGANMYDRSSMYAATPRIITNCDEEIQMTKLNAGNTYASIVLEHSYSTAGHIRMHIQSPALTPIDGYDLSSISLAPDSKRVLACYKDFDQCRLYYGGTTTQAYIINKPARYDGTAYFMSYNGFLLSDNHAAIAVISYDLQEIDELVHFDVTTSSISEYTNALYPVPGAVAGADERVAFPKHISGPKKDYFYLYEYLDLNDRKMWVYKVSDMLVTSAPMSEVVKVQSGVSAANHLANFEYHNNSGYFSYTATGSVATFARVNVLVPPTPAPTLAPTPSPTFECVGSSQCITNTEVCGPVNTCEVADTCTNHTQCYGDFVSDHLPYCNSVTSKCKDLGFTATCANAKQCVSAMKGKLATHKGLMTAKRTVTSDQRFNATSELISRAKAQLQEGVTPVIIVKNTETGTFSSDAIDQVGQTAFLNGIKTEICKDYDGVCTVSIVPARRALSRDLQSQSSVTVQIEYEVDDEAYAELSSGSLGTEGFEAALAAELGIGAGNITVSTIEGQLVVSITLIEEESTNGNPSGTEILDQIQAIEDDLTGITNDLVSELNLTASDIESSALDLCNGRDCNGRGTCNEESGECECVGEWWGVNCETACTCLGSVNGPCTNGYCACEYPEYGLRCELTSDCDTCGA